MSNHIPKKIAVKTTAYLNISAVYMKIVSVCVWVCVCVCVHLITVTKSKDFQNSLKKYKRNYTFKISVSFFEHRNVKFFFLI